MPALCHKSRKKENGLQKKMTSASQIKKHNNCVHNWKKAVKEDKITSRKKLHYFPPFAGIRAAIVFLKIQQNQVMNYLQINLNQLHFWPNFLSGRNPSNGPSNMKWLCVQSSTVIWEYEMAIKYSDLRNMKYEKYEMAVCAIKYSDLRPPGQVST